MSRKMSNSQRENVSSKGWCSSVRTCRMCGQFSQVVVLNNISKSQFNIKIKLPPVKGKYFKFSTKLRVKFRQNVTVKQFQFSISTLCRHRLTAYSILRCTGSNILSMPRSKSHGWKPAPYRFALSLPYCPHNQVNTGPKCLLWWADRFSSVEIKLLTSLITYLGQ